MKVLSEPALANKTYSRAKTCYQNQYVEIYHPGTREKPGYVSSREQRVERPCPRTLHFHGRKSHKHKEGHHAHNHSAHPPTTSGGRKVMATPAAEDDNSCLEGTLAGGVLSRALGGALAKKDNWICRFLPGLLAVPLLDVRSMAVEPLSSSHKVLVRKTSRSYANQCPAGSPRCNKQRSPQGQPQPQELGVGPANRD